jgi:hypothetical protein
MLAEKGGISMIRAKNQVFENREVMLMRFASGELLTKDVKNEEFSG